MASALRLRRPHWARRKTPERAGHAGRPPGARETARGGSEEVEAQHGAEGEGRGLDRHVHDPEPEDLERERAEAGERVECHPLREAKTRLGERARLRRPGWRLVPARVGTIPPGREEGKGRRQGVGQRGDEHRAANSQEAHEDPGREEGAHAGADHVQAVENPEPRSCVLRVAHDGAGQKGQGHPHQGGGQGEAQEVEKPRRPRRVVEAGRVPVEQVVEQPGADRSEEAYPELQEGESREGAARIELHGQGAAQLAAEPEAGHERRHDHGHRVETDPAAQGQHPLPGHLVDEGRGAAQEEGEPGHRQRSSGSGVDAHRARIVASGPGRARRTGRTGASGRPCGGRASARARGTRGSRRGARSAHESNRNREETAAPPGRGTRSGPGRSRRRRAGSSFWRTRAEGPSLAWPIAASTFRRNPSSSAAASTPIFEGLDRGASIRAAAVLEIDAKARGPAQDQVVSTVGEPLALLDAPGATHGVDRGPALVVRLPTRLQEHHADDPVAFETVQRHLHVAWLEDMQRHRHLRKEARRSEAERGE